VVDVGQERLQGADPLGDSLGDRIPLSLGEDPRQHIQREGAFLAVEVEGDTLIHESPGQATRTGRDVVGGQIAQGGDDVVVGRRTSTPPEKTSSKARLGVWDFATA